MNRTQHLELRLANGDIRVRLLGSRPRMVLEGQWPAEPSHTQVTERGSGGIEGIYRGFGQHGYITLRLVADYNDSEDELIIYSNIANDGRQPVRVDFVQPFAIKADRGGVIDLGEDASVCRIFLLTENAGGHGTRVQAFRSRLSRNEEEVIHGSSILSSQGMSIIQCVSSGVALAIGFTDFQTGFSQVGITHGAQEAPDAQQLTELFAEFEYLKALKPGQTLDLPPLWMACSESPLELLERYADRVKERMKIAQAGVAPSGWISWYAYRQRISEELAIQNADLVKQSLSPLGANLCLIDLGWNHDDRPGDWEQTNQRFPGGIQALCDSLSARSLQTGLWITPLTASVQSSVARKNPDWLLRDTAGNVIHFDRWYWEPYEPICGLDPTHPQVHEWLYDTFRRLYTYGVRFFKLDFASVFRNGLGRVGIESAQLAERLPPNYVDARYNRMEACRKIYGIIREAIEDAHLSACNVPILSVIGIADSVYLANDVGNLTDSESLDERPLRRRWSYFAERSRQAFSRYFFHNRCWLGNPDCFVAENDAEDRHARSRMQVVMLAGGQVKCSNQLPTWRKDRLDMFLKGLPPYGETGRPVDLFENEYPQIVDLFVHGYGSSWHVVGVFNWSSVPQAVAVSFEKLIPPATGSQAVFEFWEQEYLGCHSKGLKIQVEGESCRLLCLRDQPDHPELLSTDLHFTQGAVEIVERQWDPRSLTLSGTARRAPGHRGNLTIFVPAGYACARSERLGPESLQPRDSSIVRLPLLFENAELHWAVFFEL
jgi:hypothetical protein